MNTRDELIARLAADGHVRSQALIMLLQENTVIRNDVEKLSSEITGDEKFKRRGLSSRVARAEIAILVCLTLGGAAATKVFGFAAISKLLTLLFS